MDTREKILSWPEFLARAGSRPVVVSGYFDPLTAGHASRLEALSAEHGPLAVAILNPPDPVVPAEARAVLVAALRCVSACALAESDFEHAGRLREEDADLERRRALIAHVHTRHGR